MAIKNDCFALRTNPKGEHACGALTKMFCKKGECPFYKSFQEEEKQLLKSKLRLINKHIYEECLAKYSIIK